MKSFVPPAVVRTARLSSLAFVHTNRPEPHRARTTALLAAHPELSALFGPTPSSALYIAALVALQLGLATALARAPLWLVLICAYSLGAAANHALFVFLHECAHNLVLRTTRANKLVSLVANLPIVFPAAIGFRKYHLEHHAGQGEYDRDADLSGLGEAAWVGRSSLRKALWLLTYSVTEGLIRPGRITSVKLVDRWTVANLFVQLGFTAAVLLLLGGQALAYLALSLAFSIGLHPLGARWIQEHFLVAEAAPEQETYSYYGPLNRLAFNVGYHNEHHDLVRVPWSRLPAVRAGAPEFYDSLYAHRSWTRLLLRFLLDPELTLYSRIIRGRIPSPAASSTSAAQAGPSAS